MDEILHHLKKPWNDSPVNTNKQWFPIALKWCELDFVHPQYVLACDLHEASFLGVGMSYLSIKYSSTGAWGVSWHKVRRKWFLQLAHPSENEQHSTLGAFRGGSLWISLDKGPAHEALHADKPSRTNQEGLLGGFLPCFGSILRFADIA